MGNNNILVVEDDADYREMVMLFLRRSGYRAVEAATGLEAVSRARVTRPNLILMDLDMPAMTGDQATARLKADPSTRNIPVIVTTAFSYGSLVDRAITAGADEIMHKPFALKLLRAAMQRQRQFCKYRRADWCWSDEPDKSRNFYPQCMRKYKLH
jgi:two-component system cell cycle response regulator DivK